MHGITNQALQLQGAPFKNNEFKKYREAVVIFGLSHACRMEKPIKSFANASLSSPKLGRCCLGAQSRARNYVIINTTLIFY